MTYDRGGQSNHHFGTVHITDDKTNSTEGSAVNDIKANRALGILKMARRVPKL